MLTQSEFSVVVRSFMDDVSARCVGRDDVALSKLSGFNEEVQDRLADFRDPNPSASVLLSASFGLVNEVVLREWDAVMASAYEDYVNVTLAQGQSTPGSA